MSKAEKKTATLSTLLSDDLSQRIDALRERLHVPEGARPPTKSDLMRLLILAGLREIEADPSIITAKLPKIGAPRSSGRG